MGKKMGGGIGREGRRKEEEKSYDKEGSVEGKERRGGGIEEGEEGERKETKSRRRRG